MNPYTIPLIVVPAAITAALGMLRGVRWARKAAYCVIAWFALVPASIAAMTIYEPHRLRRSSQ